MKKLIAITALISGVLLFLVPRYLLPACEYQGYSPMKCSDTAKAEFIVATLLLAIGGLTFLLKSAKTMIAAACAALILYGISFWLPDNIGYCHSSRMPCNYGMVPGVRFIDTMGALLMGIAIIGISRAVAKKGKA